MPRISVVIPHHNRIDLLLECLDSLRSQSLQDFDIVVVDNASTDGSPDVLARARPEVRCIRFPENRGFAAAVNAGIRSTTSPYVLLLNNDLRCDPHFVRVIVEYLERNSAIDWAAPLTLRASDPDTVDNCGLYLSRAGIVRKRMAGRRAGQIPPEPESVLGAAGNAALFRRSFFDRVGYLDEKFFAYCEDWELALRARRSAAGCAFVPTAICYHHESGTWGRNSDLALYHFQRNMEIAYFRRWGWTFHLRYLLPHVMYSAFCLSRWAWRGKGRLALRAKSDAFRSILRLGC